MDFRRFRGNLARDVRKDFRPRASFPDKPKKHPMAHPKIIEVTDSNFETEIAGATVPVLVDFWAPWCGPCRMIGPVLEALADEVGDTAKVAKVNVDDNPTLAAKFNVRSIPLLLFMKEGKVVDQVVGAGTPKDALIAKLKAIA